MLFFNYDPPYKPTRLEGFSEVLHSVIAVSDMEKSLWFYRDLLEMDPKTDMIMDNDTVHEIIGVPEKSW